MRLCIARSVLGCRHNPHRTLRNGLSCRTWDVNFVFVGKKHKVIRGNNMANPRLLPNSVKRNCVSRTALCKLKVSELGKHRSPSGIDQRSRAAKPEAAFMDCASRRPTARVRKRGFSYALYARDNKAKNTCATNQDIIGCRRSRAINLECIRVENALDCVRPRTGI